MHDELVRCLRHCADAQGHRGCAGECKFGKEHPLNYWCIPAMMNEAADAIEELSKHVPPVPHGRLIDADALRAKQQEDADLFQGSTAYGDKCRRDEAMNAVANIVNAPTIIPASFENPTKNARYSQDNPAEEGE